MDCRKQTFYRLNLTLWMTAAAVLGFVSFGYSQTASNGWATKMFTDMGTPMTRNFGDLALHAEAEQHFRFRNIYQQDIEILSAQSSCSCTKVTVPKKLIKPGEVGDIVARVDTSGKVHVGRRKATVTVHFVRPYAAEVQLQVSSHIRADVVFDPGVIEFGGVTQGNLITQTTYLKYTGSIPNWQIVGLKKNSPSIRAEAKMISHQGNQKTYKVDIQLLEDAEPGYINDLLQFTTNEAGSAGVFVPVHGLVYSTVSVKPAHLQLGVVHPDESVTRNLVIRGSVPFQVVDVTSDDERMSFKTANQSSIVQVVPVTISIPKEGQTGEFQKTIHIKTSLKEVQELEVPVIGIISKPDSDTDVSNDEINPQTIVSPESIENAVNEYKNITGGPVVASFEDIDLSALVSSSSADTSAEMPESSSLADNMKKAHVARKFGQRFLEAQKLDVTAADSSTQDKSAEEIEESVTLNYDITVEDVAENSITKPLASEEKEQEESSESEQRLSTSPAADEDGWFSVEMKKPEEQSSEKKTAEPVQSKSKVASQVGVSFKRPVFD